MPMGAYLRRSEEWCVTADNFHGGLFSWWTGNCFLFKTFPSEISDVLPHNDGDQAHDGFVQAVKKIPQELALLFHVAND